MAVIKPSPTPPQPTQASTKTGLITTVNGTKYDVTPDPPPAPGQSWSNLNTTLPPLSIDADTPDATVLALSVSGAISAGSGQYPGPTITAETASANDAISGTSASGVGVSGKSTNGVGVYGASASSDAIQGRSQSSQHAGVSGGNSGGGPGVWAQGSPAGYFDGDIRVTGDVVLPNAGSGGTSLSLKDLNSRLVKAEQALAQLAVHIHTWNRIAPNALEDWQTIAAGNSEYVLIGLYEQGPGTIPTEKPVNTSSPFKAPTYGPDGDEEPLTPL